MYLHIHFILDSTEMIFLIEKEVREHYQKGVQMDFREDYGRAVLFCQ
ncbi:hypothetical protein XIS1_520007 [Xenorhabdus innexi]|uniref:Uncharacterized protein n=1 Tax=Xenorhabdus innexi TaxID=290109 RepID=A0A1N6MZA1_9GAMM|nr:hypothetical protein XIS1_520007 [Xenorhabdus innexi]